MTSAEHFTRQFYTWEYRGRGWFLGDEPVHLEAPFIPFIRHLPQPAYIDDGKRPTIISSFLDFLKGKKPPEIGPPQSLDYDTLEPFSYDADDELTALHIKLPKERSITPETMKALLIMLSSAGTMLSFEIIGNAKEITLQFVCNKYYAATIQVHISSFFPKVSVIRSDQALDDIILLDIYTNTVDFGLRDEFVRPIAGANSFKIDPLIGFIGVLESLTGAERGGIQILFAATCNAWGKSIIRSVTMQDGTSFFEDEPQSPALAQAKTKSPLFGVTIRAFAQGEDADESASVLGRIIHTIRRASTSEHNALIPLPTEEYTFETRMADICLRQSHRLGMLLNADELITLLHFPSEHIHSKKLHAQERTTKALPTIAKGHPFSIGMNTHHGISERATISAGHRLQHTYIIGTTGTGKSTLLLSMIAQDMQQGNGAIIIDPHGDLIDATLKHVPQSRIHDVIIIDPSDSEYPVAFNILHAHSDIERQVLSSDLVAIFKRQSTSWGDQMNSVFANAIIAFLENTKAGTLADLRRFLIEKPFRAEILKTVTDPLFAITGPPNIHC